MQDLSKVEPKMPIIVTKLSGKKRRLWENSENDRAMMSHLDNDRNSSKDVSVMYGAMLLLSLLENAQLQNMSAAQSLGIEMTDSQRTAASKLRNIVAETEKKQALELEKVAEMRRQQALEREKAIIRKTCADLKKTNHRLDSMQDKVDKLNADALNILSIIKARIPQARTEVSTNLQRSTDLI